MNIMVIIEYLIEQYLRINIFAVIGFGKKWLQR